MTWNDLLQAPVSALNNVRSNVWSIGLIAIGAVLTLHGHGDVGGSLITGGFAILRSSDPLTAPVPSNAEVPPPNPTPEPSDAIPTPVSDPKVSCPIEDK